MAGDGTDFARMARFKEIIQVGEHSVLIGYPGKNAQEAFKLAREVSKLVIEI